MDRHTVNIKKRFAFKKEGVPCIVINKVDNSII